MITTQDYEQLKGVLAGVLGQHLRGGETDEILAKFDADLQAAGLLEPYTPKPTGFDAFWDAYDKKVARKKAEALWARLSKRDRAAAMAYLPAYKKSQPDKRYRKNPDAFLRNRGWEDEIIDQTTHLHHATLPYSPAAMAEIRKNEVRELSRIATAGAAALASLVGSSEGE